MGIILISTFGTSNFPILLIAYWFSLDIILLWWSSYLKGRFSIVPAFPTSVMHSSVRQFSHCICFKEERMQVCIPMSKKWEKSTLRLSPPLPHTQFKSTVIDSYSRKACCVCLQTSMQYLQVRGFIDVFLSIPVVFNWNPHCFAWLQECSI